MDLHRSGGRWVNTYSAGAGSPASRYDAAAAMDTSGGALLFGGNDGTLALSDSWLLK